MTIPASRINYNIRGVLVRFVRHFYDARTKNDTIFAPATTINTSKGSPLSVIRVSGCGTREILQQFIKNSLVLRNVNEKPTRSVKIIEPRKATLAKLYNFNNHELIDIGLVLWFPNPNSYTGEDSCEFHIHGSQSIQATMLNLLGSLMNVRPAEPGEFTRRAVFNKKMSLLQAESLPELISSRTDLQRKMSLKGLSGSTRAKYEQWIGSLMGILAHLEASIDFGEDELVGEGRILENCLEKLGQLEETISRFIKFNSHSRNFIQNGARLAILGKPNAGKSTLMNILCQQDKSIVSNLSGTTRDVIEHSLEIGGYAITLCDTAGLRELDKKVARQEVDLLEKHDSIEREGIKRAIETASRADLVVYLIDATKLASLEGVALVQEVSREIGALASILGNQPRNLHLVINKTDLNPNLKDNLNCSLLKEALETKSSQVTISLVSCKSAENMDEYLHRLVGSLDKFMLMEEAMNCNTDGGERLEFDYVNERHIALLKSTQRHLAEASRLNSESVDEIAQHVRESLDYLSRIVGSVSEEQVFDVIFRDFCIGK